MSIAATDARPPRPQFGGIAGRVRRAILKFAAEKAKRDAKAIWAAYREREFYAGLADAIDGVCERYGLDRQSAVASINGQLDQFEPFDDTVDLRIGAEERQRARLSALYGPQLFLLWIPDQEFLSAVEAINPIVRACHTNRAGKTTPGWPSIVGYADRAFRAHGIPWKWDRDAFRWVGDPVIAEAAIGPALESLTDPRLDGARSEFQRALEALRRGGTEANERAIGNAANAVESVLEVLLITHGVDFEQRDGAHRRWQRLCEANKLPVWSDHIVLGASRPRNRESAHGAGAEPRRVQDATATATVGAAAVGITLLVGYLPTPA